MKADDAYDFGTIAAGLDGQLLVNRDNVSRQMMNQAELYTYYAIWYHRANKRAKLLDFQRENLEASVDKALRAGGGRVTEKDVRTACHDNPAWVQVRRDLLEAEDLRDALESILRAFEHRRDMLVNLGATVREEIRAADVHVNRIPSRK